MTRPENGSASSLFGRLVAALFLLGAVLVHLVASGPAVWTASVVLAGGAAALVLLPLLVRIPFSRALPSRGTWRLTREGAAYLLLTGAFGLSALNSGDNLLFLVFGVMTGGFIASVIWARSMLKGWQVERSLPADAFCGESVRGIVKIASSRRSPLYSLDVRDEFPWNGTDAVCGFLKIGPRSTAAGTFRILPSRRGIYELDGVRVSTRFPFGFVEVSGTRKCPRRFVVFPRRVEIREHVLSAATAGAREAARAASSLREGDDQFHGLREYRPGDNPKRIHWRSTARHRKPILKVFERNASPASLLLLDLWGHEEGDSLTETVLSVGASLMVQLARRGVEVDLAILSPDLKQVRVTARRESLASALGLLAGAQSSLSGGLEGLAAAVGESVFRGRHVISVARRRGDRVPGRLETGTVLYAEDWLTGGRTT